MDTRSQNIWGDIGLKGEDLNQLQHKKLEFFQQVREIPAHNFKTCWIVEKSAGIM